MFSLCYSVGTGSFWKLGSLYLRKQTCGNPGFISQELPAQVHSSDLPEKQEKIWHTKQKNPVN